MLLQVFAIAVLVFPSDTVFKPLGASGYPASLVGMLIFGLFMAAVLFGFHDPRGKRHPIRGVLAVMWVSMLASYIFMDRGVMTGLHLAAADRTLISLAVITGVALVAAERLSSIDDVMRVVRVLCWAGAFCALVALLQYWTALDLSRYLRELPGFVVNHDNPAIQARGSLNRAAGTAITPIELGVVMAMLLPIAACLGLYDVGKPPIKRWAPLSLIVLGVAASVSRSAILSVVVSFTVLVVLLPPVPRLATLGALPIALAAIFMSAHGLIGTLASFFAGASSDPSIRFRTHDYPLAEEVWQNAQWLGHGPGSWLPANSLDIFDNQYLDALVMFGLVGVVALLIFLLIPALAALLARRLTSNPDLRVLCAALAAAGLVAPVASLTFDSMSFPMFVNVYALVIGLIGACSRLALAEREPAGSPSQNGALTGLRLPIHVPRLHGLRPGRAET